MKHSRYIVGIDLGTTNIAVSYIDTERAGAATELFKVPQLRSPGELVEAELLPSFCYFPNPKQIPEGSLALPWRPAMELSVGLYARDHGVASPARFVASAKSWLCHSGVNRKGRILPWNSQGKGVAVSPLEVTRQYLEHVRHAWDHCFGSKVDRHGNNCVLSSQQVVVTVPASFDETARELTLEAAKLAGYHGLSLLEEPLAAFYCWLSHAGPTWQERIRPGMNVLVVDVGGGTCDFSVVSMGEGGALSRAASGNHLLLGGDNIDMALAREVESEWNTQLDAGDWAGLCQKTREAKERLLGSGLDSVKLTLLAKGSSVVGRSRECLVRRETLLRLLDDGFFPAIGLDAPAPRRRGGIQSMGLPYEPDPAVTKHLLEFLRYAAKVAGTQGALRPDLVLFNGGSMIPEPVRRRVLDIMAAWFPGAAPLELESRDLSLAVALGAAYYGRTRRGEGVKVRSATAKAYYIQVAKEGGGSQLLCVMPRGVDENLMVRSPGKFQLQTNQKVQFPLFSSATRLADRPGDTLDSADELSAVSTLVSVLKFGKSAESRDIQAGVAAELTETGLLRVLLESEETSHQWPLHFDARLLDDAAPQPDVVATVDLGRTRAAIALAQAAFAAEPPASLTKDLEAELGLERDQWPVPLLRELADALLELPAARRDGPAKETRWLNLLGFCLRPGFGDPADELRLRALWKLWPEGVSHPNNSQAAAEWWVLWRRVAPGLGSGHQRSIFQEALKQLCHKGRYVPMVKAGPQAKAELWRCLGALEMLSPKEKQQIGAVLVERHDKLEPYECWALARLGARRLFKATADHSLAGADVRGWVDALLAGPGDANRLFALSRIAAMTGDRVLDLPAETLALAKAFLVRHQAPEQWVRHLEEPSADSVEEQAKVLGDSLPLGLTWLT